MPKRARSKKPTNRTKSKKTATRSSAVVAAAETAGRTLGRAVNALERAVRTIRPRRSSTPTRKRVSARKRQ